MGGPKPAYGFLRMGYRLTGGMVVADTGTNRGGVEEQAGGGVQGGTTGTFRKGWGRRWRGIVQAADGER